MWVESITLFSKIVLKLLITRTHIHALPKKERHLAFRSRMDPKCCTQNVLALCDFNMRFTFVSAGWEGTTHDCKVLNHAIYDPNNNFPFPPKGMHML